LSVVSGPIEPESSGCSNTLGLSAVPPLAGIRMFEISWVRDIRTCGVEKMQNVDRVVITLLNHWEFMLVGQSFSPFDLRFTQIEAVT
jgi:hypothetical protein